MSDFPTTQIHLLLQVRDRGDQQAWIDFVALYRPAIYRFARRRGLQEADAQDLAIESGLPRSQDHRLGGQFSHRT
jgi:hypothetical protein